jgi:hypothetical protein
MPKIIAAGGNPDIFNDDVKFLEYTGRRAMLCRALLCFIMLRCTVDVVV